MTVYPPCPECGDRAVTVYSPGEHRDHLQAAGRVYVCWPNRRHKRAVVWTERTA